jgi:hypothetical protein
MTIITICITKNLNNHASYSTCEDHTITYPIPRTHPFKWISNSAKPVHFTHKSEPLNTVQT